MPHVDICDAERLCTDAALVLDASTRVASAAGSGVLRVTLPHTVGLDADRTIPNVVETLVYCGLPLEKYACFLVQRLEFLGRWHRCLKSCEGWRGVCVRVL